MTKPIKTAHLSKILAHFASRRNPSFGTEKVDYSGFNAPRLRTVTKVTHTHGAAVLTGVSWSPYVVWLNILQMFSFEGFLSKRMPFSQQCVVNINMNQCVQGSKKERLETVMIQGRCLSPNPNSRSSSPDSVRVWAGRQGIKMEPFILRLTLLSFVCTFHPDLALESDSVQFLFSHLHAEVVGQSLTRGSLTHLSQWWLIEVRKQWSACLPSLCIEFH